MCCLIPLLVFILCPAVFGCLAAYKNRAEEKKEKSGFECVHVGQDVGAPDAEASGSAGQGLTPLVDDSASEAGDESMHDAGNPVGEEVIVFGFPVGAFADAAAVDAKN